MANGIDISSYQGQPDFDAVKASGLASFVYAKCTEGLHFTDDQYARNARECQAREIPFGAYHYFRFEQSPVQQAEWFFKSANIRNGDLLPMVDVEVAPEGAAVKDLVASLAAFLQWLEHDNRFGSKMLIYTGYAFWVDVMKGSDAFSGHPLWVAAYNNDALPPIPQGFTQWKIWQHSSSGSVPGMVGNVDLDRSNGDLSRVALHV